MRNLDFMTFLRMKFGVKKPCSAPDVGGAAAGGGGGGRRRREERE